MKLRHLNWQWSLLAVLAVWASPLVADGSNDLIEGEALYAAQCVACHGAKGQGNAALLAPNLTGLEQSYVQRQLTHFRDGIRGADSRDSAGAQMRAVMRGVKGNEVIAQVSAYVDSLAVTGAAHNPEGNLRNGSNVYNAKCGACHGGKAEGNAHIDAPRLSGQESDYLVRQYSNFKQGLRGGDPKDRYGQQMKFMADIPMAESDLQDLIAFIHSLAASND